MASTRKFDLGDRVFAKMKGYSPWPAIVEGYADLTPGKMKYHIFFYGTKQVAVSKEEDLYSYADNKEKLGKPKSKNSLFNKSIAEIDAELKLISQSKKKKIEGSDSTVLEGSDSTVLEGSDSTVLEGSECNDSTSRLSPENNENTTNQISKPHRKRKSSTQNEPSRSAIQKCLPALEVEGQLLDIQFYIQNALTLKKADTKTCLRHLDDLATLSISALIVKKYPELLDFLKKLQNYVGNKSQWNMSDEEMKEFDEDAALIRDKAKQAFEKIKCLFVLPEGKEFSEYFKEELKKFEKRTSNMTRKEFFCLATDPVE